jgi:hypothetical protein
MELMEDLSKNKESISDDLGLLPGKVFLSFSDKSFGGRCSVCVCVWLMLVFFFGRHACCWREVQVGDAEEASDAEAENADDVGEASWW